MPDITKAGDKSNDRFKNGRGKKEIGKANGAVGLSASARAYEQSIAAAAPAKLVLQLYVSGMTPRSRHAIENIRRLCEIYLAGNYDLEIIDIYQQPDLAKDAQVIAAPTLVKSLPPPLRRIIGDLEETDRVVLKLGLAKSGSGKRS